MTSQWPLTFLSWYKHFNNIKKGIGGKKDDMIQQHSKSETNVVKDSVYMYQGRYMYVYLNYYHTPSQHIITHWVNTLSQYWKYHNRNSRYWFHFISFLMFNTTFSNISAILWRPVLVVEEAGVPGENHWSWASNW